MSQRDFYDVLGVAREASESEVKKAYRQAALKFHPDRNPGDKAAEDQFKEATEAYQVLSDAANRQKYDQFGHAAFNNAGPGNYGDFTSFAEEIFGDIFGSFFGMGGAGSSSVRAGRDLRYNLDITLEEAAFGIEKEINFPKRSPCEDCLGSGARKGSSPEACQQCGGSGQIRIQQGFFAISRPCNVCGGEGQVIKNPCPNCQGIGLLAKETTLSVKVPAGINEGQRLKLRGEGEPGPNGGPSGDLYVVIALEPHPVFARQDTELICEVPISYSRAALGGEIKVPTLEASTSLKIPAGTPSGKVFRIKGQGIVDIHTGRCGDQHVRVYIHVPTDIKERQRELLTELAELEGDPVPNESHTFFDKVKEFFD